jgi:hypothetical protein
VIHVTDDERQLLADVAEEAHRARRELAAKEASQTTAWVRDPAWKHPPSDEFGGGCTE